MLRCKGSTRTTVDSLAANMYSCFGKTYVK